MTARLVEEAVDVVELGRMPLGNDQGLLHGIEIVRQDAKPRCFRDRFGEALAAGRIGLDLPGQKLAHAKIGRAARIVIALELGVLEFPRQHLVGDVTFGHRHSHPWTVDVRGCFQGRTRQDHVGVLSKQVRASEINDLGAIGGIGEEAYIGLA